MSADELQNSLHEIPLREITAPRSEQPRLSEDALALREGYLQFGQLLDNAASDFDPTALVTNLQGWADDSKSSADSLMSAKRVKTGDSQRFFGIWGAFAAALAVLLAFISWQQFSLLNEMPEVVSPKPSELTRVELPWTDPLDDQLAIASEHVRQMSDRDVSVDTPLWLLLDQMREMEADLQSGSL